MEELIEDLLLYCRLGAAELAIAPVDLNEVLVATLRILRPEIENRGAEVDAAVLPWVNGDPLPLQNLLENLVGNALKFSIEGTPPKVHLGAERVDDGWCLSVSDNGIGIDPSKRDRIFGMFARLNPQDHYGGTGIGLAICKRIVERHGGRISVECNPGGGSRFLVAIPGSPGPAPTVAATNADTISAVVRQLEVLLVEDSAEHAKLIAALLAQAPNPGYHLQHVGSVASAIAALTSAEVDCILLDLSLPDAADLEAVAQVTAAAPSVPVVVITSSSDDSLAFAAVREGAQDYLVKGHIDVTQLSRSIGWAVHRKALETRLARDALHDALTGLPNRTLMIDRLRSALSRTERSGTKVAVFFMDLDDFKPVNDRFGHDAGDKVLVVVADRLRDAVRPSDTVARIGGDEFVVIWEGIGDANQEWELLRTRLAATVAAPITLGGATVQVTASIGLAVGGSEREPEALLREADLAMYQTKRSRL
jgi:diguanylate cyclase (GGDEF)-like protein